MTANQSKRSWQLSREDVLRAVALRGDELRDVLARNPETDPRVLRFLAEEGASAVKRAVAANRAAPAVANRALADSPDEEVRAELAAKIGRLFPELSRDTCEDVRRLTLETLACLAEDALPRVRSILAEEIKHLDCIPKGVALKLARDVQSVAAPILEYSPLLSDADLIDIITTAGAQHALLAIARRRPLAADVSDAIVAAKDIPAVSALLDNPDAEIRAKTLEKIAELAEAIGMWQEPVALRTSLSQRVLKRVAGFTGSALIENLAERHELRDAAQTQLRGAFKARLEAADDNKVVDVAALHREGKLDDNFVVAAAEEGRRASVIEALSLAAAVPRDTVERIFAARQAKPLTALVWRAGLSMRAAFRIQTGLLHLPAGQLLPARDGVRFPLDEDEMRWHLRYFGIEA